MMPAATLSAPSYSMSLQQFFAEFKRLQSFHRLSCKFTFAYLGFYPFQVLKFDLS
jgi:hypothetical protein